jgi:xylose isomerase
MLNQSFHSICAWTFNSGKGGFTPGNIRPNWSANTLDTVAKIHLIKNEIIPRLPDHIVLGFEMHYDYEFNDDNARRISDVLSSTGITVAMTTPGLHPHMGYGGPASHDPAERAWADRYTRRTIEITYEAFKPNWHPEHAPTLVLWNGSWGYDLGTPAIRQMMQYLKEGIAGLTKFEASLGGELFWGLEPKPNEGHPAMLLPTVASAIAFWYRLRDEFGVNLDKKGVNKEIGHSEMIGLDAILDTVEELDHGMMTHAHLNSQGYNDGIILGGPGKFDIDHGVRVNGFNISLARLMQDSGYSRWKGHDMQPRPYDSERQAVDRVVRSILSWDACEKVANTLDMVSLEAHLVARETAKAEDLMMDAVSDAIRHFRSNYS